MSETKLFPKKNRSPNFTDLEVSMLLKLASPHIDILLDKKTDTSTNKRKSDTWKDIAHLFAALTGETRDPHSLRSKFEGVKSQTKSLFNKRKELGSKEFNKRWTKNYDTMFKLVFVKSTRANESNTYSDENNWNQEELNATDFVRTETTDSPFLNDLSQNGENQSDNEGSQFANSNADDVEEGASNDYTTYDIFNRKTPEKMCTSNDLTYPSSIVDDIDVKLKKEKLTFMQLRNEELRALIRQENEKQNRKREKHELKMVLMRKKLQQQQDTFKN